MAALTSSSFVQAWLSTRSKAMAALESTPSESSTEDTLRCPFKTDRNRAYGHVKGEEEEGGNMPK